MSWKERIIKLASLINLSNKEVPEFTIESLGIVDNKLIFNIEFTLEDDMISITKEIPVKSNVDVNFLVNKNKDFKVSGKDNTKSFKEQQDRIKSILDNSGILKRVFKLDKSDILDFQDYIDYLDKIVDNDKSFKAYIEDLMTSFREQGIIL